jgi:hypothetical protein
MDSIFHWFWENDVNEGGIDKGGQFRDKKNWGQTKKPNYFH